MEEADFDAIEQKIIEEFAQLKVLDAEQINQLMIRLMEAAEIRASKSKKKDRKSNKSGSKLRVKGAK